MRSLQSALGSEIQSPRIGAHIRGGTEEGPWKSLAVRRAVQLREHVPRNWQMRHGSIRHISLRCAVPKRHFTSLCESLEDQACAREETKMKQKQVFVSRLAPPACRDSRTRHLSCMIFSATGRVRSEHKPGKPSSESAELP